MALAVPPSLPMKLRRAEPRGKATTSRVRVLVTITVLGSAGPLRFLVDEGETVAGVVRAALRLYAREGRLPALGSDADSFFLCCADGRSDALDPGEMVSFNGCRSFVLFRKPRQEAVVDVASEMAAPSSSAGSPGRKGIGSWKAVLSKLLLSFRV